MSNGEVCCILGVCCPAGSAAQLAALAHEIHKQRPHLSEAQRGGLHVLQRRAGRGCGLLGINFGAEVFHVGAHGKDGRRDEHRPTHHAAKNRNDRFRGEREFRCVHRQIHFRIQRGQLALEQRELVGEVAIVAFHLRLQRAVVTAEAAVPLVVLLVNLLHHLEDPLAARERPPQARIDNVVLMRVRHGLIAAAEDPHFFVVRADLAFRERHA